MSNRITVHAATIGDIAFESKVRADSISESGLRVYGVDRADGLTPDAKYTSKDLGRYKVLRPGMFAYNPMRLNIGSIAYCTDKHAVGLVSPDYVVFGCKPDVLDPDYFSYAIKGPEWRRWTTAAGIGSVRIRIYFRELAKMPITVPSLHEQKAIAHILSTLDAKIELNQQMNATLEAMARALFQSWFVDFDPVRAKLDNRKPIGLDTATAALFPAHFQESSLGHIPQGWIVGKVGEHVNLSRAAINPGNFSDEIFDHFSLPAFDNGRMPKADLGGSIMSNKHVVAPESVLLSKLNPRIPRIWLPNLRKSHRSVCSTEFMVVCAKPGSSREYLFSLFTNSSFASVYGTLVTGTTGSHQRVRPESVLEMSIVIPTPSLIQSFTNITKPMFERITSNIEQSRTLATLRDALLPKLLSGELTVAKATSELEAVT